MLFDPIRIAREVSTVQQLEELVLLELEAAVGFDAAFMTLRGASPTTMGLDPIRLGEALRPGSAYADELEPVKKAALAARGVAVDTDVLGVARVHAAAYFRDLARPIGGKHSLMAYLVLRSDAIGGLMLGRTGGAFRASDLAFVERLLPSLAVARASFGLPGHVARPLQPAPRAFRWPWRDRRLAHRRTSAGELSVRDRDGFREMVAQGLAGSEMIWSRASLSDPSDSGWPYVDLFHVAAGLARGRETALFVGCGGAVGPRQFAVAYPGIRLDVVDSDPVVVDLARTFYRVDEIPNLALHVADGASFVARARPASWDVAVVDAYDGDALGDGIATPGFFDALRAALRAGGAIAFNLVGSLDGAQLRTVVRAAGRSFDDLRVVPVMTAAESYRPGATRNIVLVGLRRP
jgi:spermidine synthase